MPSWLLNSIPVTPELSLSKIEELDLEKSDLTSGEARGTQELRMAQIEACNSLDAIRDCTRAGGWILGKSGHLSKFAFNHLLSLRLPLGDLLEFLEDYNLNAPAAKNVMTFLGSPALTQGKMYNLKDLDAWIGRAVALGKVSEKDIRKVLRGWMSCYYIKDASSPKGFCYIYSSWNLCRSIFTGLEVSKVRPMYSLGLSTIILLFDIAAQSPKLDEGIAMGATILSSLQSTQQQALRPAILGFVHRFFSLQTSTLLATSGINHVDVSSWLIPLLDSLPQEIAFECVARVSWILTKRASVGTSLWNEEQIPRLRTWFKALSSSRYIQKTRLHSDWKVKWMATEQLLAKLDPGTLKVYLLLLEDQERCCFILRHWILTEQLPPKAHSEATALLLAQMLPIYPRRKLSDTSIKLTNWLRLVPVLYHMDPATLDSILPQLGRLILHMQEPEGMVQISDYLALRRESEIPENVLKITDLAKTDPVAALESFNRNPWYRLEQCPGLAEGVISDPRLDPEIIFDLLGRDDGTFGAVKPSFFGHSLHVNPKRVDSLHSIATVFANAEPLEPRVAYRKVIRCFKYFTGRHDLLRPEMVQALFRAGVTRFFDANMGVSNTQIGYVLKFVRQVEGDEIADRLEDMCDRRNRRLRRVDYTY